jgi:hypothetical protein
MSSPETRATKSCRISRVPECSAHSDDAIRLATTIESDLSAGRVDALSPEALQALMTAGRKAYAAQVEAGRELLPFT